jgi:hypothetical protein
LYDAFRDNRVTRAGGGPRLVYGCVPVLSTNIKKRDEPNAWVELEALTQENCWTASIHLKNPTRYPLKVQAVSVPLLRVPVDDKQGFLLAATEEALKPIRTDDLLETLKSGDPGRFVKMSVEDVTVDSGSESVMQVMLQ